VTYVRGSFFAGEDFHDLGNAQAAVERWCLTTAGMRIHGTTHARPLEVFRSMEAPCRRGLQTGHLSGVEN
jgi:hypothetical protein